MKNTARNIQLFYYLIIFFAISLPFALSVIFFLSNNLTFWYDNARDLLLAWENLNKHSLIGPQSGVPGIYYGPYWIWLLSIGLFFSKNPLIVTFITATIPYFILFPLIWFRLNKFFDRTTILIGWLFFMFSSGMTYATQLWNPYPAPLLTLAIIYLLIIADFTIITKKQNFISVAIGILMGILINIHISFGLALLCGLAIFLIADTLYTFLQGDKNTKKIFFVHKIYSVVFIFFGLLISFLPSLLFEARHGFHQTQKVLDTLFKFVAVVSVPGLNKTQILLTFLKNFGNLLHIPPLYAGIVLLLLITSLIITLKQKVIFQKKDTRILLLLISLFSGNLFIYVTAKNPVWEYHFIGVDILFLLLLTFIASRLSLFRKGLIFYTITLVCFSTGAFLINFHKDTSYFQQQKNVVNIISRDAKN